MRWPTITFCGATICEIDGEAEGRMLQIRWFGFVVQVTIGKFVRVGDRDAR